MVFVQRDESGEVIGLYANKQLGYAEEELPGDHTEVAAFRARTETVPPSRNLAAEFDALKAVLIEKTLVSEQEIEAKREPR